MQGMTVQDFSAGPRGSRSSVAQGPQEPAEKSFGKVLVTETGKASEAEKTGEIGKAGESVEQGRKIEQSEESQKIEVAVASQDKDSETDATPFFMAALFDQSASFVKPSDNAELIAAAERTQELIGAWLQPEQGTDGSLEEIMTVALDVLEQTAEVSTQGTVSTQPGDAEKLIPVLSDAEAAELRALMAVMLQSGQVPAPVQSHPMVVELQKQFEQFQSLTSVKEGGIQPVTFDQEKVLVAALGPEALTSGKTVQPEVAAGLQENQIAKMLGSRGDRPLERAQVEPIKQAELATPVDVAPLVAGEVKLGDELPLEIAKLGVQPITAELPIQHGAQIENFGQRLVPQGEIAAPKMMQLPSGQQLAESQLVDQVVTQLAGSSDGESGRMRLRLHPAELGSVRLDLIIDGDRLRAHLQAQTHQVQEVLDRHLPQLREALQQQGLKIDEFRVDVQSGQEQAAEQRFGWQQDQHKGHSPQSPWLDDNWQQPEIAIPLQQLLQQQGGGISLRV